MRHTRVWAWAAGGAAALAFGLVGQAALSGPAPSRGADTPSTVRQALIEKVQGRPVVASTARGSSSSPGSQHTRITGQPGQSVHRRTASGPTEQKSAPRHNIVFVLTDDLSRNLVAHMPHVVEMRRTGTEFTNYTVTDSLCCPSRSSIFSGRFPHDTHVFTNSAPDGGFGVFNGRDEEKSTFATDLQSTGYRTGFMGKYLNGYEPDMTVDKQRNYVPPGWDEWDATGIQGYNEYGYTLNHNHHLERHGNGPHDYLVDVMGDKADRFIGSAAKAHKPFLLELATYAPHRPSTPAPQDRHSCTRLGAEHAPRGPAFNRQVKPTPAWLRPRTKLTADQLKTIDTDFCRRVEAVQSVDRMIGSIEQTLRTSKVSGTTDIVFSSDNGFHLGQYYLDGGKMTAFDTDVNVPLVVTGPDAKKQSLSQPAENIDLRPTFADIARTPSPKNVDGRSLLSLLNNRRTSTNWRAAALIEHHGPDVDRDDPDYQKKASGNPPTYEAVRTRIYTYVEYTNGQVELYNHKTDPHELREIHRSAPPSLLDDLHRRMKALTSCHGSVSCWSAGG